MAECEGGGCGCGCLMLIILAIFQPAMAILIGVLAIVVLAIFMVGAFIWEIISGIIRLISPES